MVHVKGHIFPEVNVGPLVDFDRNVAYLVHEQPDFRLAQLVYADLLSAHTAPLAGLGRHRRGR